MQETEFEIDRNAVGKYFLASMMLMCFYIHVLVSPLGILRVSAAWDSPSVSFQPAQAVSSHNGTSSFVIVSPTIFARFFSVCVSIFILLLVLLPLLFALFIFGKWLTQQQASNLRYWLEGTMVRTDGGVFFLFRKSIPFERITDINLVQGPLMRHCGIWTMQIQTAGSIGCGATLYGVREPEKVRELILSKRKSIYGEKSEDA